MYDILSLGEMVLPELREIADTYDVPHKGLKKEDLIYKILDYQAVNPEKFKDAKVAKIETSTSSETDAPKQVRVKKPAPIKKPKQDIEPEISDTENTPVSQQSEKVNTNNTSSKNLRPQKEKHETPRKDENLKL